MASPLLRFFPRYLIARAITNGFDLDYAKLDAMNADASSAINTIVDRLNGVTNADGTLKNLADATAQALAGVNRFSATASQTAFTTTIAWRAAFTNLNVMVTSAGVQIDPNAVTVANSGGFLRVTIAAQAVNTIVVVSAFESGAGLLTLFASTSADEGLSLLGLRDLAGLYTATTGEAAFAEVMTALNDLIADIGSLAEYVKRDGSVAMTDDLDGGTNKGVNFAAAEADGELVIYEQLQAYVDALADFSDDFLKVDGSNPMLANLNMGGKKGTNAADGAVATDFATYGQMVAAIAAAQAVLSSPVGTLRPAAYDTPDTGWLACDGSAVSRTTYAALYAKIGVTYGAGDTTTTFNLPDGRGRSFLGAGTGKSGSATPPSGANLSVRATGQYGGEETHTLTIAEMPAHTHTGVTTLAGGGTGLGAGATAGTSGTSASRGGDTAHNVLDPFFVGTWFIKT